MEETAPRLARVLVTIASESACRSTHSFPVTFIADNRRLDNRHFDDWLLTIGVETDDRRFDDRLLALRAMDSF